MTLRPQFVTDVKGRKKSVILSMKEYKNIIEELEELEDIRLYDEAKALNEASISIDEAFRIIDEKRQKRV